MKKTILIFLCLFSSCSYTWLNAQTPLGSPIYGVAEADASGEIVALSGDGKRLAISALSNDAGGEAAGHVRIFEYVNEGWQQLGNAIEGQVPGDFAGISTSLSEDGSRIAVAYLFDTQENPIGGCVRIFEYLNGDWQQVGGNIKGQRAEETTGFSVALSANGNRVAIGAPTGVVGPEILPGVVRIFDFQENVWTQVGEDIFGTLGDGTGIKVSLSADGNRVAISADSYNGTMGENSGIVRIFDNQEGVWTQVGENLEGTAAGNRVGAILDLSADGKRVAIGSRNHNNNLGQVRVFELFFDSLWVQLGLEIEGVAGGGELGGLGLSLSADGSRLAVSGPYTQNGQVLFRGHTQIFDYNNNGFWEKVGETIEGEEAEEGSGGSIALSGDGTRLAIGAPKNDVGGMDAGNVRVFDLSVLTAIQGFSPLNISFYPNPVTNLLYFKGGAFKNLTETEVRMLDLSGKVVLQQNLSQPQIDLSQLSSGMYFLWMETEEGNAIQGIVKE